MKTADEIVAIKRELQTQCNFFSIHWSTFGDAYQKWTGSAVIPFRGDPRGGAWSVAVYGRSELAVLKALREKIEEGYEAQT